MGLGGNPDRFQKTAGCVWVGEHPRLFVTQKTQVLKETSVISQSRLEGGALDRLAAGVDMPGAYVKRIGRSDAIFFEDFLVSGCHQRRLGHSRAPIWVRLLE